MTARAIWAIGVGQCINWGVLYYAFGALIVAVDRDLGIAPWILAGAFSLGLFVSALAAPTIGRYVDRGHGPGVMRAGGLAASALLVLWTVAPSATATYVVWALLGLCMAAILYEPAFVIVGRAIRDDADRLRAIATITVCGGFASTVFFPLTGALVDRYDWHVAVWVLAAIVATSTLGVHATSFQQLDRSSEHSSAQAHAANDAHDPRLPHLALIFGANSFAGAALTTNLVAALVERHFAPTAAAAFAGLFGVMQLPGRLFVMNGRLSLSASQLVWGSIILEVAGLAMLVPASSTVSITAGVTIFAIGSGMATVARPYIVLLMFGAESAGRNNGYIARAQSLARAAGPVAAAALAARTGYGAVFAVLAVVLVLIAIVTRRGATSAAG